jgi:peptidoglycan/xylan/chitin deacetylase (PgdA/CDA1 family)
MIRILPEAAFCIALGAASAALATPPARPQGEEPFQLALTFDDLPVHASLPKGMTRAGIAAALVKALRDAQAPPPYGFVNAIGLEREPDSGAALQVWRGAGFSLGNHTYSHMDLDQNSVEAFEDDIVKDEPALLRYAGGSDWHWFRFPYLREGSTAAKQEAIRAFLEVRGYRIAEVTYSADDWAYSDAFARCTLKEDQASIDWMRTTYLRSIVNNIDLSRREAQLAVGRDVKHVALFHIGGFTAAMMPAALRLMQAHGVKFITLEEAVSDPVYAQGAALPPTGGGTLLDRIITAVGKPWPSHPETPIGKLNALCD